MKKTVLLTALCVIIVSACGDKQNKNSIPKLESYSEERFEAIVSQMAKVEDMLLYEKRWDKAAKMEFDRLADTLLHLVEHSDNPILRVGTRAFAFSLEGNLYDMGAIHYLVDSIDKMAEVPYRWTIVSQNEDSLNMEMEIPLLDDNNNWIDLDIFYSKQWEKDSLPAMFSILIPRTLLTDTNQFYLMFVNTLSDTSAGVIKHLFSWEETYHEVYEDECYIRVPLPVVLAYIEKTDGIIIHYEDGNNGVMHSTYVFKEQYLYYLKEYCKGIKSYLNN